MSTCRLRVGVKDDVHGPVQDLHVVGHGVQRLHRLLGEHVGHPALREDDTSRTDPIYSAPKLSLVSSVLLPVHKPIKIKHE